jgi:hypothetical protein
VANRWKTFAVGGARARLPGLEWVNAVWNIAGWMRLDAGVGYRVIGASNALGDQLRGGSGSLGVQFGGR